MIKTTMNIRSRLLWSNFGSISLRMSKKTTKPPTHYETLDINPQATQGEIKSAYFKLSKEYHPDKNSSEEATAKFRDITEAYEVLGNFRSRKMYDRSILTRTDYEVPQQGKREDPRMRQYYEQAAAFRDQRNPRNDPIYNFDAWTKAHYGDTLHRTFKDRAQFARRRKMHKEEYTYNNSYMQLCRFWAFVTLAMMMLIISWKSTDYDNPSQIVRKDALRDEGTMEKKLEQNNGRIDSLLAK